MRKLSLYQIQTLSHLQSENSCWICQVLVASEVLGLLIWPEQGSGAKIKGAQLKINLHNPIVNWMLIKNGTRTMMVQCILTALLECKVHENAYVFLWQHFFELWVAITLARSIRSLWFLDNFWLAFNALSFCGSWFLIELLQFYLIWYDEPHCFTRSELWRLASDLMAYISKATGNWHVQHWVSHCRCNVASFKCKSKKFIKNSQQSLPI